MRDDHYFDDEVQECQPCASDGGSVLYLYTGLTLLSSVLGFLGWCWVR